MSSGVETSTQAGEQYKEAKTLFQSASLNLREWASNYSKFLENGLECDRTSAETMKVLGTSCNLTTDTIFTNGSHHPKWPQKERHCSLAAESTIHWVSVLQPLWMQDCSFRNCGNDKKIGTRRSVNHINKNGARLGRTWLYCPLSEYPDILEETSTNFSTWQMPLPKPIQQQYTSSRQ